MSEEAVKVFISYSWDSNEHKEKVLALSNSLRKYGIDCQIDRYHQLPPEGWYQWMMDQIEESDFVLVVCTKKYNLRYRNKEERGQGREVTWEGGLIIAELYSGQGINNKYIPILFYPEAEQYIPQSLKAHTPYRLFGGNYDPTIEGGLQSLYRHLTNQPVYESPYLYERLITLPTIQLASSNIANDGTIIRARDLGTTQRGAEEAVRVFYSYSRKDQLLREKLDDHLAPLRFAGVIVTWYDLLLEPGSDWKKDISDQLDTADVILLLISANFLSSKYCYSIELKRALERDACQEACVIPIILEPCDWKHGLIPFSKLTALPNHEKAITEWENREAAFASVAESIRGKVEGFRLN